MSKAERIRQALEAAFSPEKLDIADDSEKHRGHMGHREGGESHFTVTIIAGKFKGISRIERHRMVNRALAEEMATIHALAIKAFAPGEG